MPPALIWPPGKATLTAQAQVVEKRQREQGEAALAKRLAVLHDYEKKLLVAQAAKLQDYQAAAVTLWGEDASRRNKVDAARWLR